MEPDVKRGSAGSEPQAQELTRRHFVSGAAVSGGLLVAGLPALEAQTGNAERVHEGTPAGVPCTLNINREKHQLTLDPRTTLLDALREELRFTGTKKGCDHGQCGACTVLVNGRRINSCLALAISYDGDEVTTIEGLAKGDQLHPVQAAFLEHDGFQCGYCTPGQICSAVALLDEARQGQASAVTVDVAKADFAKLSDAEIRERMSGNICRCGAYPNIVAAVRAVQQGSRA